jgi:hypothetical protein
LKNRNVGNSSANFSRGGESPFLNGARRGHILPLRGETGVARKGRESRNEEGIWGVVGHGDGTLGPQSHERGFRYCTAGQARCGTRRGSPARTSVGDLRVAARHDIEVGSHQALA